MLQIARVLRARRQPSDPKRSTNRHILRKRTEKSDSHQDTVIVTKSRLDKLGTCIGIDLTPSGVAAHRLINSQSSSPPRKRESISA